MNKKNILYILLGLVAIGLFYWWGKVQGRKETQISIANNVAIVKEIAEMSALQVSGNANINSTNREDPNSMYGQLKNVFTEKTLNISIPYDAKYGVDMSKQNININTDAKTVVIQLPEAKLLSFQMRLDKATGIEKTGLLYEQNIDNYLKTQQKMYSEVEKSLMENSNYKQMAQEHIRVILERYYQPLGMQVKVEFGNEKTTKL